jgi:5-methylcytosine-specific restriction endonuclease McrA
MANVIPSGTPRPCKVCGSTIYFRRICNACQVAAWKAAHPDKLANSRARDRSKPRTNKWIPSPLCAARAELRRWANPNRLLGYRTKINELRRRLERKRVVCSICGATVAQSSSGKKRYCSKRCKLQTPANIEAKKTHRKRQKATRRSATVESVSPLRVFMRDGWRCHLCGGMTDKSKRGTLHPNAPELDHIVPLSKGGEHSYRNTACAHKRCNAAKSDRIIGQPSLLTA